jgi:hypothetical protein
MNARTTAVALAACLATGCAIRSDLMAPTGENPTTLRPQPGKALVVFVRPAFTGYAIQAVVYDGERFIGVVSRFSAVPYQAEPGAHRLMVVSEAADFLDADLAEGRTYFVEVQPRMGAWRARFSIRPVSATAEARNISAWLAEAKVVTPNAEGQAWAARNQASAMKKKAAYEPKWIAKANRPELRVDDGTPPLEVGTVPAAAHVAE